MVSASRGSAGGAGVAGHVGGRDKPHSDGAAWPIAGGLVVAATLSAASPLRGAWTTSAEPPLLLPTPGLLGGLWDAATLWLPVGERAARGGFAALLLALAVAAAAGGLAFHLYRGPGRRPAAFAAVPVSAALLLAWLREAPAGEAPATLGFCLFATVALGLVVGARVQASGHAGRRVAGCLAALAGALLWPRAGVGLLAGLLAYGAWTARTDAVWRRAAAALCLGLSPLLAFGTGLLRHDPTDSSWRAAWWVQLRLAPALTDLRRVVGAALLYPALALLLLLLLPLRWRGGGLLLAVAGLELTLADRAGLLAPPPALLVLVSVAACGWIWLAGSVGGRLGGWATTLVVLSVTAMQAVLAPGPVAKRRPEASLLALQQRGLVAPGDVLLAHDPWLVLAFAAAQRDEGLRPDVELHPAASRDQVWLRERRERWSRDGRRVLSDSFNLGGHLRDGSPGVSGPLFCFAGNGAALAPEFMDLRPFSPAPAVMLRPDDAARWERLHVERARHRRALGRHEEAMLALAFADADSAVLTRQLQVAELSRLPATESSELGPGAWSQASAPASAMAEAGDLLLELGGGADGAARLAEAADLGVAEALGALVRWQLRAGEDAEAKVTLRVLVAAPVLRPQVLAVCRWLLQRGRPEQAAALLGAVGPAAQFAPEELALRLATLRELAAP